MVWLSSASRVRSASGPAWMSTVTFSTGLVRNAMPSATTMSSGKPYTQNTALRLAIERRAAVAEHELHERP